MLQGNLERVVAGARRSLHVRIAVEVEPKGPGSVHRRATRRGVSRIFAVGAARSGTGRQIGSVTQLEAERLVAWIRFLKGEQLPPHRADIVQGEHSCRPQLT